MNFYLTAVNDLLRHQDDQPSIGLILCKTRDRVVAEYSLRDVSKPIGVSEYQLAAALPEKLKGTLPTIEELENELSEEKDKESRKIPLAGISRSGFPSLSLGPSNRILAWQVRSLRSTQWSWLASRLSYPTSLPS
jgi:hypothetical protein